MGEQLGAVAGTRNIPGEGGREVVAGVEVSIAVLSFEVRAVPRDRTTVRSDLGQSMGPGVNKLRAQSVPCPEAQRALQRVVVRGADAVELVHAAVIRILPCILAELVDVQHDREFAALAAYVTHLPNCHAIATALLDVQLLVEEIGSTQVLADDEEV